MASTVKPSEPIRAKQGASVMTSALWSCEEHRTIFEEAFAIVDAGESKQIFLVDRASRSGDDGLAGILVRRALVRDAMARRGNDAASENYSRLRTAAPGFPSGFAS